MTSFDTEQDRHNEILRFGRINTCVGSLQLRDFSPQQAFGAAILLITATLLCFFFGVSLVNAGIFFAIAFVIFLIWGGSDYTEELEKWYKPQSYYSEGVAADEDRAIPTPAYKGERYTGDKKNRSYKWERELGLRGLVSYERDPSMPGVYIVEKPSVQKLVKGGKKDHLGKVVKMVYGLELPGISPTMTDGESMTTLYQIEDLFKALPDVAFKFYWDSKPAATTYKKQQLALLNSKKHDPLSKKIIIGRGKRASRLEKKGLIAQTSLRLYVSKEIVLGADYTEAQGWKDKAMKRIWPLVKSVARMFAFADAKEAEVTPDTWLEALDAGFNTCYLPVLGLLSGSTGLGMDVKALTADELFALDWSDNHATEPPKCPRFSRATNRGLEYVKTDRSDQHLMSILFTPEQVEGKFVPTVPLFSQTSVYLPHRKKWAGCIRLDQQISYSSETDGSHSRGHLRFLANQMEGVTDFRLITEIVSVDPVAKTKEIKRGVKNRKRRMNEAAVREQTVDFSSDEDLQDLIEAGRAIKSGEHSLNVGTIVWLYRDTEEELDEALRSLSSKNFPGKTSKICQSLLKQRYIDGLPYAWGNVLCNPYIRRLQYLRSQAIPLMPFTQPQKLDDEGILFTGRKSHTAFYIDFFNKKNHTGLFAKSGGGKSMILFEIIVEAVMRGIPALILDSPRGTGQSTYTPLLNLLNKLGVSCAYHNIRDAFFNVLDFTPGPCLDLETAKNHLGLLNAIVVGTRTDNPLADTIDSLLGQAHDAFFKTVDTQNDKPILGDFVNYFLEWSEWYKANENPERKELDALSDIKLQLKGCLAQPWGKRINAPTSFSSDVKVLCIGLTNADEDSKETLVYALAGANIIDRLKAEHDRALFIVDEGSTSIRYDAVAKKFVRTFSEGRKEGCNGIFAATEADNLWNSPYGQAMISNFDNILCGLTNEKYREKFIERMGFKSNILAFYRNKPDLRKMTSSWYLKREDGDQHVELEYGTTPLMLAIGATEPAETAAKKRVMANYEDELEGFEAFAKELAKAYSKGLPATTIGQDHGKKTSNPTVSDSHRIPASTAR